MYKVGADPVQFRCPICGEWVDLKEDKNGKPYGFCDNCGLQFYFRQPGAIGAVDAKTCRGTGEFRTVSKG